MCTPTLHLGFPHSDLYPPAFIKFESEPVFHAETQLIENEDERVAAVACQAVLDRAFGKPRPSAEKPEGLEDKISRMGADERRARLRELFVKASEFVEAEVD